MPRSASAPIPQAADAADVGVGTLALRRLGRMPYADAHALQQATRDAVAAGRAPDTLLLVEHDPVITLGRRGDRSGILAEQAVRAAGIAIRETERGGNVTYHGPGQLVAYPILDLRRHGTDIHAYIRRLEAVAVRVCAAYGIEAAADSARPGVYTAAGKIASIGVHVSRWVTMHGLALNVDPEMAHWALIQPCGLPDVTATSIAAECARAGRPCPGLDQVTDGFVDAFAAVFGVRAVPLADAAVDVDTGVSP